MARDYCKCICHAALGHRDACISWHSDHTADARDDFITNPCFGKCLAFLAAAPKDKGITAFESYDDLSLTRVLDQQLIDLFLRAAMSFGFFADINQLDRKSTRLNS